MLVQMHLPPITGYLSTGSSTPPCLVGHFQLTWPPPYACVDGCLPLINLGIVSRVPKHVPLALWSALHEHFQCFLPFGDLFELIGNLSRASQSLDVGRFPCIHPHNLRLQVWLAKTVRPILSFSKYIIVF